MESQVTIDDMCIIKSNNKTRKKNLELKQTKEKIIRSGGKQICSKKKFHDG